MNSGNASIILRLYSSRYLICCSFSNDYFFTLGLKDAGIIFEDIDDFYRFIHPEDIEFYKQAFAEMLSSDSKTSQIRVRCISEKGK